MSVIVIIKTTIGLGAQLASQQLGATTGRLSGVGLNENRMEGKVEGC